jgi:AcrR family transcriptional regulator
MGALAEELGISRATLYTWVGSKDRLLGEVLWSFAANGLKQAIAQAEGTGADYILDVFERFDRMSVSFEPLLRFVEREPELALRLITSKHRPVQARMIAAARDLLTEQVQAGALELAFDVDTLAYLIIRVAESFTYSDVITGSEPDVDKALEWFGSSYTPARGRQTPAQVTASERQAASPFRRCPDRKPALSRSLLTRGADRCSY